MKIPAHIWCGIGAFALPALFFLYKALTTPSRFSLHLSPAVVGALLVAAGVVWIVLAVRHRVETSPIAGARVQTHRFGPGRPMDTIVHELGHKRLITTQGGRVTHFVVNKDGSGYVRGYLPSRAGAIGDMATSLAGGLAEGSWVGAGSDRAHVREVLNSLPADERSRAESAAYALARSKLFWNPVGGDARKIYREGWSKS